MANVHFPWTQWTQLERRSEVTTEVTTEVTMVTLRGDEPVFVETLKDGLREVDLHGDDLTLSGAQSAVPKAGSPKCQGRAKDGQRWAKCIACAACIGKAFWDVESSR